MASLKRQRQTSRLRTRKKSRAALAKRNRTLWFLGAAAALILCAAVIVHIGISNKRSPKKYSSMVKNYKPLIEQYAEETGIPEYVDYLMAIMQVESGGRGKDVMQSSESLGLPRNTLDTEESIQQGCAYLAECLESCQRQGCDTLTAIQAYNYGVDYVDFVAARGGVETIEIAEEFAAARSNGETVSYSNRIAREYNGGYRYKYGNMFYAELVNRIVQSEKK